MSSRCDCCGCVIEADYGTSSVEGSGTAADPFTVSRVDPAFSRPRVKVTSGVVAAVPNNTPTNIPFTTEVFDTNNMWVVGTPDRITFQTAGMYIIGARITWASNITSNRSTIITHVPLSLISYTLYSDLVNAPSGDFARPLTYAYHFEAGEYINIAGLQQSGGALNIQSTEAWAVYVGRYAP